MNRLGVILAIGALGGAAAVFFWQQSNPPSRGQIARLPPLAAFEGKPVELQERLARAQARATAEPRVMARLVEVARLYHANGFREEAEACWMLLRQAQPRVARWSYYLADLRQVISDDEGMNSLLEQTVQHAPDYAPAWLKLAELNFKRGRLDDAERAYARTLALRPGDPYARFGLARIALQRGQRDDARQQMERLVNSTPDFPSAHNFFAELLAQAGDARGAMQARALGSAAGRFRAPDDPWLEALRDACYDPTQLLIWGASDAMTGRGDRAKPLFERVVQLAPHDPRGYQHLGGIYQEQGDLVKARDLLERGSKLPGATVLLHVKLCELYLALHEPDAALRAADAGLIMLPGSAELLNARGSAQVAAQRFEDALDAYRAASATAPNSADFATNVGLTLVQLGRKQEARAQFKRALELQPFFPKAVMTLTQLEIEAGDLEAAYGHIHPFYEQYPGSAPAREWMGTWYLKSALKLARAGALPGAEQACREGIAVNSAAPELYGLLSVILTDQGREAEAENVLETAYDLKPPDPRISLALGRLYSKRQRTADARRVLSDGQQLAQQRGDAANAAQHAEALKNLE